MLFEEEGNEACSVPLQTVHPGAEREAGVGLFVLSTWVSEMVLSFRHLVGVSCDEYEADLMKLFTALEMERGMGSKTPGRSGGKLVRELKSLECSVKYDGSTSGSRRGRKVGRALVTSL